MTPLTTSTTWDRYRKCIELCISLHISPSLSIQASSMIWAENDSKHRAANGLGDIRWNKVSLLVARVCRPTVSEIHEGGIGIEEEQRQLFYRPDRMADSAGSFLKHQVCGAMLLGYRFEQWGRCKRRCGYFVRAEKCLKSCLIRQ